jgi:DNA invertase Pin-like site-specific DNA recombinase
MTTRVALYLRVSTANGQQTTENQRLALEDVAKQRGWRIVAVYEDQVSGAKGRERRPGLDAMLKDATRGKFDLLAVWAMDRLGRSLLDLLTTLRDLEAVKVDLYMHQQAIDTSTPTGKMFFHVTGAFAQFEREMIVSRVKAGQKRAVDAGKRISGHNMVPESVEEALREQFALGHGIIKAARIVGCGTGTAHRVKRGQLLQREQAAA